MTNATYMCRQRSGFLCRRSLFETELYNNNNLMMTLKELLLKYMYGFHRNNPHATTVKNKVVKGTIYLILVHHMYVFITSLYAAIKFIQGQYTPEFVKYIMLWWLKNLFQLKSTEHNYFEEKDIYISACIRSTNNNVCVFNKF